MTGAADPTCAARRYAFPAAPGGPAAIGGPVPCRGGFCEENAPAGGWSLWRVAGAPGALWAIAPGALLRNEAGRWSTACPPGARLDLTAIGGRSADAVWLGGGGGFLARWDGAGWIETAAPAGTGAIAEVCGDAREAFAVDADGAVLRWDGHAWSLGLRALAPPLAPASVRCNGAGRAFATTADGLVEWTGGAWAPIAPPADLGSARAVWAAPGGDLWAAGTRTLPPDPSIPAGWPGSGPREVPALARRDGAAWTDVALPVTRDGALVSWVTGSGPDDVWVALGDLRSSQAELWRFDGARWTAGPATPVASEPFVATRAQAWLGYGDLLALAGGAWVTEVDAGPGSLGPPVVAAGPGDFWLLEGGGSGLLHLEGNTWRRVAPDPTLRIAALSASDAADVWAAGYRMDGVAARAAALSWDGSGFTHRDLPAPASGASSQATAVFTRAAGQTWVATLDGGFWDGAVRVLRWDGAAWSALDPGLRGGYVLELWASGPDDVWLLAMTLEAPGGSFPSGAGDGAGNAVLHWDGAAWTARTWPGASLRALGGTGPRDVWVSGTLPGATSPTAILARWDGARWTDAPGPALAAIAADGATLWGIATDAGGSGEARLVRLEGRTWIDVAAPLQASSLAVAGGEVWAVSGSAALHRDPR